MGLGVEKAPSPLDKKEYLKHWREAHKAERKEYDKKYQEENKERLAEQKRAYYLANREAFIAKAKKQYEANPQAGIDRATAWNKAHPTKKRELEKSWKSDNPTKVREGCRLHRERHPEFHKKRLLEWRKRNPLLVRMYCANRRGRIQANGGDITPEQVAALYETQGGKCGACQRPLNMQYQLDHVMPLSLGGEHKIENAQILCRKCNQMKHAMHPDAWAVRVGKLFNQPS
jgi:5-methylcytosine-specific restriction endonuclease McrA